MNIAFMLFSTLVPIFLILWVLDKVVQSKFKDNKYYWHYKKYYPYLVVGIIVAGCGFVYSTVNSLGPRNTLQETYIPSAPDIEYQPAENAPNLIKKQDSWNDLEKKMEAFKKRQDKDIENYELQK